ncbi:MAG: O-antigen ligase family protein [Chloroflexi bacterium]|nr:O-antigen ligase family protein [Chloroflexota bacterium]
MVSDGMSGPSVPQVGARPLKLGAAGTARFREGSWLVVAVAVPLLVNPLGVQVFDLPKLALLRTIVVALAVLLLWERFSSSGFVLGHRVRIGWSDPRVWAAILGVVYSAASLVSLDIGLSLWGSYSRQEGLYTLLAYLLLFVILATDCRRQAQVERLILAISLGSIPIIVYGLLQVAGIDLIHWQTLDKSRAIATVGRSNFLGSYLVMSVPIAVAALASCRGRWLRVALALGLAGSLCLLVLTDARSAWTGISVTAMAMLAMELRRRGRYGRILPYIVLGCVALVVFIAAYLVTLQVVGRFDAGGAFGLSSLTGSPAARLTIWQASLQLIAERPLLGFGPGSFSLAFHHVFPPQLVFYQGRALVTDRAHDVLLQQALDAGLLGLVAYAALMVTLVAKLVRGMRRRQGHGRVVGLAILAVVGGHLVDLLFSFDVATTAAIFWVVAGAGVGLSREATYASLCPDTVPMPLGNKRVRWRITALALSILALAVAVATNLAPLIADTYAGLGFRPGSPWADRVARAELAVGFWPIEPAYRAELGLLFLERARDTPTPERALELTEQHLATAVAMRPLDPSAWALLADARAYRAFRLNDGRAFEAAVAAYERAIELAPTTATLHAAYGALELMGGRIERAEASLERAVALDTTDARAWRYLAEAYSALGRPRDTAFALSTALYWEARTGQSGK